MADPDLAALRDRIEAVDRQIIALVAERLRIVEDVAAAKLAAASPFRDRAREEHLLQRLRHLAIEAGLDAHQIERLYRVVMDMSVAHQEAAVRSRADAPLRVAYQGVEGSYSHLTAQRRYAGRPGGALLTGHDSFRAAAGAVIDGACDLALLPIENTTAGSINETYDLLAGGALHITGEEVSAIEHCLLALPGVGLDELRTVTEQIEPDPERLDAIRSRRQLLVELRRKYGETIEEVMEFHRHAAEQLDDLLSHEARAAALEAAIAEARATEAAAAAKVAAARRKAAPKLAAAVADHLEEVALGSARVEVVVGGPDPGDEVEFRMSANAGMAPQPIAKAASGGELSRTMLALHQVLSVGAPTMVFDEVDAGVGGTAATAVGRALARLASGTQVLVVTHLPQVAAYADVQLSVSKSGDGLAVSTIRQLDSDDRVIELSRMLSGSPDSETARRHAEELLDLAARDRVG